MQGLTAGDRSATTDATIWPHGATHATLILAIVMFLALSAPTLFIYFNGISIAGAIEETVGARYFHTLRILYGDERPWVPQGHLVGLMHFAIHWGLTLVGYPPEVLFPRVDLFILAGILVPHAISAVCFLWAARQIPSLSGRALLAALFLAIGFSSSLASGVGVNSDWTQMIWWLALPDYLPWTLSAALLMVGAILRLLNSSSQPLSLWWFVQIGLFAGLCIAVKITFIVFPIAVGSVALYLHPKLRSALLLAATMLAAVPVALLVQLAYYLGDWFAVVHSLELLFKFLAAEDARVSLYHASNRFNAAWWIEFFRPKDISDFLYIGPLVFMAVILAGIRHKMLFVFLPAGIASFYFLIHRPYFVTWTEFLFFFTAVLAVTSIVVCNGMRKQVPPAVRVALAIVLVLIVTPNGIVTTWRVYEFSRGSDRGSRELSAILSNPGGRKTAFLDPGGNNYRLRSIHSAICKGGIQHFVPTWGESKYIAQMYPTMHCFSTVVPKTPLDLTDFDRFVVVRLKEKNEDKQAAMRRTSKFFSTDVEQFRCDTEIDFPDSVAIVCTRGDDRSIEQ